LRPFFLNHKETLIESRPSPPGCYSSKGGRKGRDSSWGLSSGVRKPGKLTSATTKLKEREGIAIRING